MRYYKFVLIAVILFGLTTTITAKDAYKAVKVYMFGFSASFNDSTVNFTDIQAVDAYVENNHTHFLVNRDEYSYQLRYYMESIQPDSNPTCLVVYALTQKNAIKKYLKLQEQYTKKAKIKYIVNAIPTSKFSFKTVLPDELQQQLIQERAANRKEE
ncbi:hypothetical protein [Prevotella intermedia]|uniref:Uncharacterized protein n=1 Tax=Prevotella intermedia TaxID=28131 RepID=A0A2G9IEA9_PREIN|nr:hypothetical protein [Prevotella intermedia]PIN28114.1 hypothetical protein CUC04_01045 [Prevotella intermedia]